MKKRLILELVVLFVVAVGAYLWVSNPPGPDTKEEAIRQAQEYKPEGICTQALVPAVHKATGARYTFSSGCLAPGWVAE